MPLLSPTVERVSSPSGRWFWVSSFPPFLTLRPCSPPLLKGLALPLGGGFGSPPSPPSFSHLTPLLSPTVERVSSSSGWWFWVSSFPSPYPLPVLQLVQLLLHLHHHQLHVVKAGTRHQFHPLLQVFHSLSAKAVGPAHSFSISVELDFKCVDLGLFLG